MLRVCPSWVASGLSGCREALTGTWGAPSGPPASVADGVPPGHWRVKGEGYCDGPGVPGVKGTEGRSGGRSETGVDWGCTILRTQDTLTSGRVEKGPQVDVHFIRSTYLSRSVRHKHRRFGTTNG